LSAGRPGEVRWQLTRADVISLAIDVVQNGFDDQELRPDLAFFVGRSATKPRGRGQSGEAPLPDTTRLMLEEVYREILDANRRGAAQAFSQLAKEEPSKSDMRPPRRRHPE